jgi:magnesium chelatase subunit D
VGGKTPLSAGLARAHQVLAGYLVREPTARPIVFLITDGRSNQALGAQRPVNEAVDLARRLAGDDRARFVVVDTEAAGLVTFGLARTLADSMNAQYFRAGDLKAETLVALARGET